jgi:glycine cleavage system regulatory protein
MSMPPGISKDLTHLLHQHKNIGIAELGYEAQVLPSPPANSLNYDLKMIK